jgi:hypothetical protein
MHFDKPVKMLVKNHNGELITSFIVDEYQYGGDEDQQVVEYDERDFYIYLNDKMQAILPYKKFIIEFVYDLQ